MRFWRKTRFCSFGGKLDFVVLVEKIKLGFGEKTQFFVFDGKTLFLVVGLKLDFAILAGKLDFETQQIEGKNHIIS